MTCPGMSHSMSWYRDTETPRYVVARSRSRYGADTPNTHRMDHP